MTTEDISAHCAEKPKRGRPEKLSAEVRSTFALLFPEIRSRRGLEEVVYWSRAFAVLRGTHAAGPAAMPWIAYYWDESHGAVLHKTILAALGASSGTSCC